MATSEVKRPIPLTTNEIEYASHEARGGLNRRAIESVLQAVSPQIKEDATDEEVTGAINGHFGLPEKATIKDILRLPVEKLCLYTDVEIAVEQHRHPDKRTQVFP